jgi:hypothetical protein
MSHKHPELIMGSLERLRLQRANVFYVLFARQGDAGRGEGCCCR